MRVPRWYAKSADAVINGFIPPGPPVSVPGPLFATPALVAFVASSSSRFPSVAGVTNGLSLAMPPG